jgi:hypothetical protein
MKKERLFIFSICLFLITFAGCRGPFNGAIEVSSTVGAPPKPVPFNEVGGQQVFRSEKQFTIIWYSDENGSNEGASPCVETPLTSEMKGNGDWIATCHIKKDAHSPGHPSDKTNEKPYYFIVNPGPPPPVPPRPAPGTVATFYTRPCNPPCKN